ncbi:MAG: exodeoxyribonuclease VII large subunit [Fidelibacterota bacterium]
MLQILSISDITARIKSKLENDISDALLRGEISECKFHSSGHIYLVLKDNTAILPAVIWRSTASRLRTLPAVGMDVIAYGRLNVYPPHGRYQFIIQSLQDAGRGELYIQYEAVKKQLIDEGLCRAERKKAIPKYPMKVGIVTSETGAALQDILHVFRQNAAHIHLDLSYARVQGKGAAETVIAALERLKTAAPDCVILARGGGSIEDLWQFNDETLARYIADYPLPLVTGIGHETDTSIADYVSDHRASTPTNAAEFICKYWREARNTLNQLDHIMNSRLEILMDKKKRQLRDLRRYLSSRRIMESLLSWEYRIASIRQRMGSGIESHTDRKKQRLDNLQKYLSSRRISDSVRSAFEKNHFLRDALEKAAGNHLKYKKIHFNGIKGKLFAYSPHHLLKKGYVLVRNRQEQLLRSVRGLSVNDEIQIEFHDGYADTGIKRIKKKDKT